MYRLYIANKNYSSWSLRPWVLLRVRGIPFAEQLLPFGDTAAWEGFEGVSPTRKVPCLVDGDIAVWDSLAIVEYLAERHPNIWPGDPVARAWARSACAEMHSGFNELRNRCSMNCGIRVRLHEIAPALARDSARLAALWNDGLRRFGGPFLGGATFSAVDAFFAPVAFRIQTYGLDLDATAAGYCTRVLALDAMQEWYSQALREKFRDEGHEEEVLRMGRILEDRRAQ